MFFSQWILIGHLSSTHPLTHSLTHSLSQINTHSLIPSLIHSHTHSLITSLTLIHSLTRSLAHSLARSFTYSLMHQLAPFNIPTPDIIQQYQTNDPIFSQKQIPCLECTWQLSKVLCSDDGLALIYSNAKVCEQRRL